MTFTSVYKTRKQNTQQNYISALNVVFEPICSTQYVNKPCLMHGQEFDINNQNI